MRPFSVTVNATAGGFTYSPAYIVDRWADPACIGVGVTVTGSAIYTVQHTFSDPFATNLNASAAAGIWTNNDFLVSASVNDDTNYAFPPMAIRLALASAAAATATMTIIQSGPN